MFGCSSSLSSILLRVHRRSCLPSRWCMYTIGTGERLKKASSGCSLQGDLGLLCVLCAARGIFCRSWPLFLGEKRTPRTTQGKLVRFFLGGVCIKSGSSWKDFPHCTGPVECSCVCRLRVRTSQHGALPAVARVVSQHRFQLRTHQAFL